MGTTIPTDDHGGFRRRGQQQQQQQQQQQRQREENSYYWYRRGGEEERTRRNSETERRTRRRRKRGAKFYRHFSPSSFALGPRRGVGGAGFRHHRDEGDSRGEDGGAWSMVPLILASSRSSSSTCSSSQISSYGGINVPYYGSLYLDFEAAFDSRHLFEESAANKARRNED